jgi:hypothetical protein
MSLRGMYAPQCLALVQIFVKLEAPESTWEPMMNDLDNYINGKVQGFEYRFQGCLGFGGKFRAGHGHLNPYFDQYPEDRTPESDALIKECNEAIVHWFVSEPA